MLNFFSGLIVFAALIYFLGIFTVVFAPFAVILALILGLVGSIGLLITLIKERRKDIKEEEKNDLSKY